MVNWESIVMIKSHHANGREHQYLYLYLLFFVIPTLGIYRLQLAGKLTSSKYTFQYCVYSIPNAQRKNFKKLMNAVFDKAVYNILKIQVLRHYYFK
jgi:cytochrome b561